MQVVPKATASMQPDFEFLSSNYSRVPWETHQPELVFLEAKARIRTLSSIRPGTAAHARLQEQQVLSAASSIYFSNLVEDAGLSFADTHQLYLESLHSQDGGSCAHAVGPDSQPGVSAKCSPGSSSQAHDGKGSSTARREVVQHVAAYAYLADVLVEQQQPLSEPVIKQAHAILMADMMREDGLRVTAGQYRDTEANAGLHRFPSPEVLAGAMAQLVQQYNSRAADPSEDPFVLASWLSYEFVAIHPFEDGNGRMCHLLLNMALLSHGIPFASAFGFSSRHKQTKKHYLQCIRHAQQHGGNTLRLAFVVLCAFRDTAAVFLQNVQNWQQP